MDEDWDIKIKYLVNGFLVAGDCVNTHAIIEDDKIREDDLREATLARQLCWTIINQLTIGGSKHDNYRVEVIVRDLNTGKECD